MHLRALNGELTPEDINIAKLSEPDSEGRNAFHYAACGGQLDKLPAKFLKIRNLLGTNHQSGLCHRYSPVEYATAYGHLDQLPSTILNHILTSENIHYHSGGVIIWDKPPIKEILRAAASCGNLAKLGDSFLSSEKIQNFFTWEKAGKYAYNNESPIIDAINANQFYKFPKVLLTDRLLTADWERLPNSGILSFLEEKGSPLCAAICADAKLPDIDLEFLLRQAKKPDKSNLISPSKNTTPLNLLLERKTIDSILHLPWPESFKPIVGSDLWEANKAKQQVSTAKEQTDIDLF